MVPGDGDTLVRYPIIGKGDVGDRGTMIVIPTLEGHKNKSSTTNFNSNNDATSELSSDLGTMVINEENEQGDDDTMVTRSKLSAWHNSH